MEGAEFFNADGSGILGQGQGASIKSGSKYGREGASVSTNRK